MSVWHIQFQIQGAWTNSFHWELAAPQNFTCVVICFVSSLRALIIQLYTIKIEGANGILCKCNSKDYADLLWVSIPPLSLGAGKRINPCSVFPCSPVPALLEITKLRSWFSPDLQGRNNVVANCEDWSINGMQILMRCIWIARADYCAVIVNWREIKKIAPLLFHVFSRKNKLIQVKWQGFEIWIFSFHRHFSS